MIKLVILDFDDTIIDNKNLDYQSFRQVSMNLNGYIPTKINISKLRGKNFLAIEIVNWLLKKSKNRFTITHFRDERLKFLESKKSLTYLSLRPYCKSFLRKLHKNQIKIVIATLRKNKKILELFITKEGISSYIDSIYNLKDKKINTRNFSNAKKIKQNMMKEIQKSYDLKQYEILSIGDSLADYHAAKKCNITHIIFKSKTELSKKSSNNIYSFKDLNFKFDSIINSNFITKKNSFKN